MNQVYATKILSVLAKRRFLTTDNGYVGLAPAEANIGDILVVILGCDSPIILRQTEGQDAYQIVGESFVYGLNDANILLGPLRDGWAVEAFTDASGFTYHHRYVNRQQGVVADEDPRLEPLVGWERIYRDKTSCEPELFQYFRNMTSGEEMNSDPRLSPQALESRGVNLQTFKLV